MLARNDIDGAMIATGDFPARKVPPDRNTALGGTIYPGHIHPLRPVFRTGVAKAFVRGEMERVRDYVLAGFGDANQDPDERHVLRSR
jgi:hypothetical protein